MCKRLGNMHTSLLFLLACTSVRQAWAVQCQMPGVLLNETTYLYCNLGDDLMQTKDDILVYHLANRDELATNLLECYWKDENYTCPKLPELEGPVGQNLTVVIRQVGPEREGTYYCARVPLDIELRIQCCDMPFKILEPTTTTTKKPTIKPKPEASIQLGDTSVNSVAVVLGLLLGVVCVAVSLGVAFKTGMPVKVKQKEITRAGVPL